MTHEEEGSCFVKTRRPTQASDSLSSSEADQAGETLVGYPISKRYALIVGCSKYDLYPNTLDLPGALEDMRLLRPILYLSDYESIELSFEPEPQNFSIEKPNKNNFHTALSAIKQKMNRGDLLFVYISSHGQRTADPKDFGLLLCDAGANENTWLKGSELKCSIVEKNLSRMETFAPLNQRSVLITDACCTGANRSLNASAEQQQQEKASELEIAEKDDQEGFIHIASTTATQKAQESFRGGDFTFYFTKSVFEDLLHQQRVTVTRAFQKTTKAMANKQRPTQSSEGVSPEQFVLFKPVNRALPTEYTAWCQKYGIEISIPLPMSINVETVNFESLCEKPEIPPLLVQSLPKGPCSQPDSPHSQGGYTPESITPEVVLSPGREINNIPCSLHFEASASEGEVATPSTVPTPDTVNVEEAVQKLLLMASQLQQMASQGANQMEAAKYQSILSAHMTAVAGSPVQVTKLEKKCIVMHCVMGPPAVRALSRMTDEECAGNGTSEPLTICGHVLTSVHLHHTLRIDFTTLHPSQNTANGKANCKDRDTILNSANDVHKHVGNTVNSNDTQPNQNQTENNNSHSTDSHTESLQEDFTQCRNIQILDFYLKLRHWQVTKDYSNGFRILDIHLENLGNQAKFRDVKITPPVVSEVASEQYQGLQAVQLDEEESRAIILDNESVQWTNVLRMERLNSVLRKAESFSLVEGTNPWETQTLDGGSMTSLHETIPDSKTTTDQQVQTNQPEIEICSTPSRSEDQMGRQVQTNRTEIAKSKQISQLRSEEENARATIVSDEETHRNTISSASTKLELQWPRRGSTNSSISEQGPSLESTSLDSEDVPKEAHLFVESKALLDMQQPTEPLHISSSPSGSMRTTSILKRRQSDSVESLENASSYTNDSFYGTASLKSNKIVKFQIPADAEEIGTSENDDLTIVTSQDFDDTITGVTGTGSGDESSRLEEPHDHKKTHHKKAGAKDKKKKKHKSKHNIPQLRPERVTPYHEAHEAHCSKVCEVSCVVM